MKTNFFSLHVFTEQLCGEWSYSFLQRALHFQQSGQCVSSFVLFTHLVRCICIPLENPITSDNSTVQNLFLSNMRITYRSNPNCSVNWLTAQKVKKAKYHQFSVIRLVSFQWPFVKQFLGSSCQKKIPLGDVTFEDSHQL